MNTLSSERREAAASKIDAMNAEEWAAFRKQVQAETRKRKGRFVTSWTGSRAAAAKYLRERQPVRNSQPYIMVELLT